MSTVISPSSATPREQRCDRSPGESLAALSIQPMHLLSLLVCVLFFCCWLYAVCTALPPLAVGFFALLMLSVYYLGRLLVGLIRLENDLARSFPLVILTGSLSWAMILLAVHSLLPGSLRGHMLMVFGVSVAGQWLIQRHERSSAKGEFARLDLFVVLFALAAATCWARGLLQPMQMMDNQVEFHHWLDYFDHASFTSQFLAREHLWRYGNFEIAGLPTPLYHYGSYLFTAGLASFASLPAYQAVVCFWTPFGTFLSGLAAYALATAFGGRRAGLCALIALLVLPDASYYGFKDPWFRYHWLQQIGSAGMYGVACLALAFLFLLEARRTRSWLLLAGGLAFVAATFFFKAQLFVVAVPLVGAWLILCYPRFSVAWRVLLLSCVVVTGLGGIVIANKLQLRPRLEPDREYFEIYCKYATAEGEKGALRDTVEKGAAAVGRSRYYLSATTLVVLSTFGGLIAGLPLLGVWAWWKRKLHAVDLMPWLAVALYVVFLVGLKDSFAGVHPWELIHRPFVWPYFVLMVWCAGKCYVLLAETKFGHWLLNPKMIAVAGILLLFLPWHMGRNVQQGKMSWRNVCYDLRFPVGMVRCARFVAEHGSREDIVQDSQCDDHLVFGSLAERRSYLSRPELWKDSQNAKLRAEIEQRRPILGQLKTANTREALQEMIAQTGIHWYLAHPGDHLDWPQGILANPAFRADGFAVYDLGRLTQAAAD